MKKYLMTGIAAVAMCAAFTSCSKDLGFEQTTQDQLDKAKYESVFVSRFGQPAANQDWGYSEFARKAATRAADPGNYGEWFGPNQAQQYKDMGLVAPEMVSAEEEEFVANWFKTNKNPQSDPIELSTFFVQQVYFGTKEYTGYDANGAEHKVIGGQHMDWLCAYDPVGKTEIIYPDYNNWQATEVTTHDDHINNFNTSAPQRFWTEDGTYDVRTYMAAMMLMVNSSTSRFGCKESQGTDNKVYYNYVLKELTFNGKVGYYVGFDYENHGQNGDFPKDGYYDDRIIKIVPGNGYTTTPPTPNPDVRIIAEDLTTNEKGDFDFNDVVFDVIYNYKEGKSAIILQAAGGTYPLYVAGHEVHAAFGNFATNVMINTGAGPNADPKLIEIDAVNHGLDIEIKVEKPSGTLILEANKGRAPHKIAVKPTFTWCNERDDIQTIYTNFSEWVKDPSTSWY